MVSNKKNKKTQLFLVVKIISIARLILINLNQNLTYTKRFLIIKVKFKIHTRHNIFLFFDVTKYWLMENLELQLCCIYHDIVI